MHHLIKFLSELGMFRRASRTGTKLAGVPFEEYLSTHVVGAAQIAYILAHLEGADSEKAACIVLFHDNGELRVGDQTKVGARYVDMKKGERTAVHEQLALLPKALQNRLSGYYQEFEKRTTQEGIIAKDADWLEAALYAKMLVEQGYEKMGDWIENIEKALETKSAKQILAQVKKETNFTTVWWQGLKKMTHKKLYK